MSLVKFDEDVNGVWDMISHQGRTCALISSGPWKTTELIVEDERISIDLPPRSEMLSCRLFSSGNMITSQRRLQPNAKAPSLKII